MKIKELEAFVAVVEEKGIVNAAEKLFCVPSNISKLVNTLEMQSKQSLFHREGRELSLTPFGRIFYDQAKDLLKSKIDFEQTLLNNDSAKLLIGGIDVALDYFIPEYICQYMIENKNIKFEIYRDYSSNLEYKVDRKQYDLVFSDGPLSSIKLNSLLVFSEKLVLVGTKKQKEDCPTIYSYGSQCSYQTYIRAWANKNFDNFNIVEIESYALILNMIKKDMGISLIPSSIISSYQNLYNLVDTSNYIECNVYMIWNKFNESKQLKDFIRYFSKTEKPFNRTN